MPLTDGHYETVAWIYTYNYININGTCTNYCLVLMISCNLLNSRHNCMRESFTKKCSMIEDFLFGNVLMIVLINVVLSLNKCLIMVLPKKDNKYLYNFN